MPKNFENFNPVNPEQTPQQDPEKLKPENEEEDQEIKQVKKSIEGIFEQHKNGSERVEVVIKKLSQFLDSDAFDGKKIKESLEACSQIEDKKEFIESIISALEPILDFRKSSPEAFEQMRRQAAMEQEGMTPINEILYYGGREDYLHIHLAPAKDAGIGKLRAQVLEGLQKLAEVIKDNKQIKEIEATSWIVAKNPKLMEKLGFEVHGEIDEEFRRQHLSGDERKISRATISRKEFLKRYFKEK